jgi:hypothetical protein
MPILFEIMALTTIAHAGDGYAHVLPIDAGWITTAWIGDLADIPAGSDLTTDTLYMLGDPCRTVEQAARRRDAARLDAGWLQYARRPLRGPINDPALEALR